MRQKGLWDSESISDRMVRHTSWRFTLLRIASSSNPELARSFANNNTQSAGEVIRHLLLSQILSQSRRDHILNVKVRYKLPDLVPACSKLPVEG